MVLAYWLIGMLIVFVIGFIVGRLVGRNDERKINNQRTSN